jgi:hypothetical protein
MSSAYAIAVHIFLVIISFRMSTSTVHYDGEKRLSNVRQLTFGGENAEAYFRLIAIISLGVASRC